MTIAIIGAGLVGSQISRILAEQGRRHMIMDVAPNMTALADIADVTKTTVDRGDIKNPWDILRIFREHKIEDVILTAANPMLTRGAQQNPYSAIELNIMGTTNVLEAARITGVRRVVAASSSVLTVNIEGGEDKGDPNKEEAFPRPTTFYATTKQALEGIALNYTRWLNLDTRIVRFAAVSGPWLAGGGGGSTQLFREAVENAMSGAREVELPIAVEWVYSKDAARASVLALDATVDKYRVFNISGGPTASTREFASTLQKLFPKVRLPKSLDALSNDVGTNPGRDRSRAEKVIGYKPEYPLEAAMRDMAGWIESHQRKAG